MRISTEPTYIGCELFIRKGDSILLGLRKNVYGAGTWALPGGHLEHNESLVSAACREAKEELGFDLKPSDLQLVTIVDGLVKEGAGNTHHYIHASFELKDPKQEPKLMEPEACEEWRYFPLSDLPKNFFVPHKDIIKNYLAGTLYASEA